MARDELHSYFQSWILDESNQDSGTEDLLYNVVGDYMALLMSKGSIPPHLQDELETDLKEEVLEMYRKTIYGFHSLKEYQASQRSAQARRRSS